MLKLILIIHRPLAPSSISTYSEAEMKPNENQDEGDTRQQSNQDSESFSVFFRDHVQRKMHDFFGLSPYEVMDGTSGVGSTKSILKNAHKDEPDQRDKASEREIQNRDIINDGKNDGLGIGEKKQDRQYEAKQESFGSFILDHVKKRITDYLEPAILRQANAL